MSARKSKKAKRAAPLDLSLTPLALIDELNATRRLAGATRNAAVLFEDANPIMMLVRVSMDNIIERLKDTAEKALQIDCEAYNQRRGQNPGRGRLTLR